MNKTYTFSASQCPGNLNGSNQEQVDCGACASSSETFWSDNGSAGLRTLASLESPRSLEKKTTDHEHSTPFYRDYNDITVMTWPFFAKCSKDVVLFLKKKKYFPPYIEYVCHLYI